MSKGHLPAVAEQLVTIEHDQPLTNTVVIAAKFGKQHKDVLEAVRAVLADCPEEFGRRNFPPTEYLDSQRRPQSMYQLTEKAFALVAMGFTGPRFMDWKIRFLDEFERRGQELTNQDRKARDFALITILQNRPLWAKIKRYKEMGLTNKEVSLLVSVSYSRLTEHLREMESLGLIQPPPNLALMQVRALRVFHNRVPA